MNKIRILYVLASLDVCNGMVSYSMNYFKNIDKDKFQIDFIINDADDTTYFKEIKKSGSNIYVAPDFKINNILKLRNYLDYFFKTHKYDIIHCHLANAGAFYLRYAKKYGVKTRILHSHATISADKLLKRIRNNIFIPISRKYANHYFACSKAAGYYLFKNKNFHLINNAVYCEKYLFNNYIREKVRKELNIKDKIVIGNIGRFSPQKNHNFIIDVFNNLQSKYDDAVLILVGEGPIEHAIREKVQRLNLEDKVIFISKSKFVNELYQAMDVFLLPSLYEGLPVVGIEAQCADLPLVVSNNITKELDITNNVKFMSLNANIDMWVSEIMNSIKTERKQNKKNLEEMNYDIYKEAKNLENIYLKLLKE